MHIGDKRGRGGKRARTCAFAMPKCPIKDGSFAAIGSKP